MTRRCEIATPTGWRAIPFAELLVGMVFRLFEADTPVMDAEQCGRWRVLGAPRPRADGLHDIDSEPVPETDAERAVREEGIFWPQGPMPWREGQGRGLR